MKFAPPWMQLARKLKRARKKRGLSMVRAARDADIERNVLRTLEGEYERHSIPHRTSFETVWKLCQMYAPDLQARDFDRECHLQFIPIGRKPRSREIRLAEEAAAKRAKG